MQAVLWPASGDDEGLRQDIERLCSNRARALKLFLHNKPADDLSAAFKRAEALYDCGARKPGGRTWKLYRLKRFSRDWAPTGNLKAAIKKIIEEELHRQGEPQRTIKVETYTRPAHPNAGPDDVCHTIIINIAASAETEENWHDGELTTRPKIPNRKIILCVTPVSKGFDCGWHAANSVMANAVMLAAAKGILKQQDAPEPIEPVQVALSSLSERPRFWGKAPEHQIQSVQVKKLVVSHGPGTRTFFVSARSKADVYDVAPRHIQGARIIAASLRVVFDKGAFGSRQKAVNFDLSLPNRCSLRETEDAENYILKHCLYEWGLIDPEAKEDRPMLLTPSSRTLSDLLAIDDYGISRREAEATYGHNLEMLVTLGALEEVGPGDTTLCLECGKPHSADIRMGSGVLILNCPNSGEHRLPFSSFPRYTPNVDALAITLAETLPIKTELIRRLDDGPVYYLGEGAGKNAWSALFVPDYVSTGQMDSVADTLRNHPILAPGIVICSRDAPRRVLLPGKHVAIAIDELFRFEGGRLHFNEQRLAQALRRKTAPKPPGRPTEKQIAQRLANARRRMQVQGPSPEAELKAIKDMFISTRGDIALPKDKVIRYEWLRDHFDKLTFPET